MVFICDVMTGKLNDGLIPMLAGGCADCLVH